MFGPWKKRPMPKDREAMRQKVVPTDTTGMDPAMEATIRGESKRLMKNKAVYAPKSMVRQKKGR
jgi:hypothetical protein